MIDNIYSCFECLCMGYTLYFFFLCVSYTQNEKIFFSVVCVGVGFFLGMMGVFFPLLFLYSLAEISELS